MDTANSPDEDIERGLRYLQTLQPGAQVSFVLPLGNWYFATAEGTSAERLEMAINPHGIIRCSPFRTP